MGKIGGNGKIRGEMGKMRGVWGKKGGKRENLGRNRKKWVGFE